MKKFLIIFLAMMLSLAQNAQTITWDGNSDGDGDDKNWSDPLNWDLDILPTSSHDVEIKGSNENVLIDNFAAQAASVDVFNSHKLSVSQTGSLGIIGSNSLANKSGINIRLNAEVQNEGVIAVIDGYQHGIRIAGNQFTNAGSISIQTYGYSTEDGRYGIYVLNNASFANTGSIIINATLNNNNPDGIYVSGEFTNNPSGTIQINNVEGPGGNGIYVSNYLLNDGQITLNNIQDYWALGISQTATLINNGTINIINTPTNYQLIHIQANSTLSGNGNINGSVFLQESFITPGNSSGALRINGDLQFNGTLNDNAVIIELAGDEGPGAEFGHDFIEVNGDVYLSDTLRVQIIDNWTIPDYLNFEILRYAETLTGNFEQIILPPAIADWVIEDLGDRLVLRKPCGGDTIFFDCDDPSCNLFSGHYSANSSISSLGPNKVDSNDVVIFSAPIINLNQKFEVKPGAIFTAKTDGCN